MRPARQALNTDGARHLVQLATCRASISPAAGRTAQAGDAGAAGGAARGHEPSLTHVDAAFG